MSLADELVKAGLVLLMVQLFGGFGRIVVHSLSDEGKRAQAGVEARWRWPDHGNHWVAHHVWPLFLFGAWLAWRWLGGFAGGVVAGAAAALFVAAAAFAAEPWFVARAIAIPLGWPRAAYVLGRGSTWVWRNDRTGAALLAGGWAAAQRKDRDAAAEAWMVAEDDPPEVVARLGDVELTGARLIGHGLLAASAGDRGDARRLLWAAVTLFPTRPEVAVIGWRWLAAEAAGRGAWDEVYDAARHVPDGLPEGGLLGAVAARLIRMPGAPDRAELERRWKAAGPASLPSGAGVVSLALDPPPAGGWGPVDADPRLAALEWHRRALVRPAAVGMAAAAWDAALAGTGADEAWLRASVVEDLAGIVGGGDVDPRAVAHTFVGREALTGLRSVARVKLDIAMERIAARADGVSDLPAVDEVRIWLGVKELYDHLVRLCFDEDGRRDAYATVYPRLCDHAEGLHRRRKQRLAFRATLGWLRAEAAILRRTDALQLLDGHLEATAG